MHLTNSYAWLTSIVSIVWGHLDMRTRLMEQPNTFGKLYRIPHITEGEVLEGKWPESKDEQMDDTGIRYRPWPTFSLNMLNSIVV
jgi:hypothetical protein